MRCLQKKQKQFQEKFHCKIRSKYPLIILFLRKKNENLESQIEFSNYRSLFPSQSHLERTRQRIEELSKKIRNEPQGRYFFDSEDSESMSEDDKENEECAENWDEENNELDELMKKRMTVERVNLIETLQRFNRETLKVKNVNKETKKNPGKFSLADFGEDLS